MAKSEVVAVVAPAQELVEKALVAIGQGKDSFKEAKARFKKTKREAQAAGKPVEAIRWAAAMIFIDEAKVRWQNEARAKLNSAGDGVTLGRRTLSAVQ